MNWLELELKKMDHKIHINDIYDVPWSWRYEKKLCCNRSNLHYKIEKLDA